MKNKTNIRDYKEKSWDFEKKIEERKVCAYYSLMEFDKDEYENRLCCIEYATCPMGHKIEDASA